MRRAERNKRIRAIGDLEKQLNNAPNWRTRVYAEAGLENAKNAFKKWYETNTREGDIAKWVNEMNPKDFAIVYRHRNLIEERKSRKAMLYSRAADKRMRTNRPTAIKVTIDKNIRDLEKRASASRRKMSAADADMKASGKKHADAVAVFSEAKKAHDAAAAAVKRARNTANRRIANETKLHLESMEEVKGWYARTPLDTMLEEVGTKMEPEHYAKIDQFARTMPNKNTNKARNLLSAVRLHRRAPKI